MARHTRAFGLAAALLASSGGTWAADGADKTDAEPKPVIGKTAGLLVGKVVHAPTGTGSMITIGAEVPQWVPSGKPHRMTVQVPQITRTGKGGVQVRMQTKTVTVPGVKMQTKHQEVSLPLAAVVAVKQSPTGRTTDLSPAELSDVQVGRLARLRVAKQTIKGLNGKPSSQYVVKGIDVMTSAAPAGGSGSTLVTSGGPKK